MQPQVDMFVNTQYRADYQQDDSRPEPLSARRKWPEKDLIEMVSSDGGMDELQVLMPLMKEVTQKNKKILWISPPGFSYAPYLVSNGVDISKLRVVSSDSACIDVIRSVEQAVADDEHAVIIAWLDWLPNSVVQRIRASARSCDCTSTKLAFLFRRHRQNTLTVRAAGRCSRLH